MKLKVSISQCRRSVKLFVLSLVAGAIISLFIVSGAEAGKESSHLTVYRSPSCSCCGGWVEYLTTQGFKPRSVLTSDMTALKQQLGVPTNLESCHTAVIDGYVIEGHVPANDIKRLIAERLDVVGIAVPGMPVGTPGMESENVHQPFTVFSFGKQGAEAFNHYSF